MSTSRSRVRSFGHILVSVFAPAAPYYDASPVLPEPETPRCHCHDHELDDPSFPGLTRAAALSSVISFDEGLLRRSSSAASLREIPEKAVRRLRSSASLQRLRGRFRKNDALPAGIPEVDELDEPTDLTTTAVPTANIARTDSSASRTRVSESTVHS